MHVLDANELFGVTSYTYDKIMEIGGKNGPDAFALYFRLMKQARIQQTNQTRSLNEFLQKSMGWGRDRLQNAKKILNELGLIDYIQVRDEIGRMQTQYIRVNYLIDEQKVRTNSITYEVQANQLTEKSADGETTTNALSTKDKCLKYINKNTGQNKFEEFWNSYPKKVKKKDAEKKFNHLPPTKQQLAIDALEKFKQTDQRKRGYIPDPTTYINQERREDEIETKEEKPNTLVYH